MSTGNFEDGCGNTVFAVTYRELIHLNFAGKRNATVTAKGQLKCQLKISRDATRRRYGCSGEEAGEI
jgi:hypothetical protein